MSVAALVAPVARQQYGLFHLRQSDDLGVSRRALRRAVEAGEVVHHLPEVYVIAGVPPSWRQLVLAAVLDAGPGAAASHRAAATLLGIAHRDAPEVVEITVRRPAFSRSLGAIVHRSGDLSPEHVLEVDGIPCTGPLRTLVDLGAVEPDHVVRDALERALQSGQVTLSGAEWMLTNLSRRGRNGTGRFRRVLDDRALRVVSPHPGLLEPRMARLLRAAGLPEPVYQHRIFDDGGTFVAQADFAYPAIREAFEVDGFETHGTPVAMAHDFEREHRLKAAGWGVTRFTWFHVVKRPTYVAQTVSGVLVAHGALLGT